MVWKVTPNFDSSPVFHYYLVAASPSQDLREDVGDKNIYFLNISLIRLNGLRHRTPIPNVWERPDLSRLLDISPLLSTTLIRLLYVLIHPLIQDTLIFVQIKGSGWVTRVPDVPPCSATGMSHQVPCTTPRERRDMMTDSLFKIPAVAKRFGW